MQTLNITERTDSTEYFDVQTEKSVPLFKKYCGTLLHLVVKRLKYQLYYSCYIIRHLVLLCTVLQNNYIYQVMNNIT